MHPRTNSISIFSFFSFIPFFPFIPVRSILAVILLFPVWPHTATAQEAATASCFELTEPVEFHFGEIKQSATVEHSFVFRNTCTDTVEIASVRSSCGCTSVVLDDRRVPPGGETRVHAKFTPPRGSRGTVSKTVSVYLKGEERPHTILRIAADVLCDIDIQPSYISVTDAKVGVPRFVQSVIRNVSQHEVTVVVSGISLTAYPTDHVAAGKKTLPLAGGTVNPERLRLAPGQSGTLTIGVTPEHVGQYNGSVGLKIGEEESVIFLYGEVAGN